MSDRSHPIRVLLDAAAAGYPPTTKETTALVEAVTQGMSSESRDSWRRRFDKACRAAALAHDGGEMGPARQVARQSAADLAAGLEAAGAEPWVPPDTTPTDPADITAAIPRI